MPGNYKTINRVGEDSSANQTYNASSVVQEQQRQNDFGHKFRGVVGSTGFKAIFDPLGFVDAASAKFFPDDPVAINDINRDQFANAKVDAARKAYEEFLAHLNGPLDMNDPEVAAIINNAAAAANRDASKHGLRGGLATSNVANSTINAQNQLQMQRRQLYQQGLSDLNRINLAAEGQQTSLYQQALADERARVAQIYQDRQQKYAGIEGLAGSVIGGIVGGPSGAQVGNSVGQVGGAQGAGQRPYVPPSYGSGGLGNY